MNDMAQPGRAPDPHHPGPVFSVDDTARAWVPHGRFVITGTPNGSLNGLTFAAKDIYDISGHRTGFGNPVWLDTHQPATLTSPVVQSLLDAGAKLCGKVITDELAYSLNGDNVHYGAPLNTLAPGCVPGGSSSGSAAAVAAQSVDFALGTDTGGSVRIPASYCGVWGIRTTHGAIPVAGVMPLQRSFDTVGWLASKASVFERVAQVLLPSTRHHFDRVLHFDEPWQIADEDLHPLLEAVQTCVAEMPGIKLGTASPLAQNQDLETWRMAYHIAGAYEAWKAHGEWIEQHHPAFGDPIAKRFRFASTVTHAQADAAKSEMSQIRKAVREVLQNNGVMVLPSSASTAPYIDATPEEVDQVRMRTMRITCIAGLAGLPQVSIPLKTAEGKPVGISLLGPAGSDLALLRLAIKTATTLSQS
ncbi:amidase [Orrella marina]|nr:amidase [Orrella marina]